MSTVNNASGVYGTLGYNFNDPNGDVLALSSDTLAHMNSIPALISSNQAQLIVSAGSSPINQSNLYQNPVASYISSIVNTTNLIITNAPGMSDASNSLISLANSLSSTANSFLAHTNRLSNLVAFDGTDNTNPYYKNAISFGKIAMYITNQTDGISNTSPILGSFTSLFIGPQLSANANTILADYTTYQTGIQNDTLTTGQYTQIENHLNTASALMSTRQSNDITFYTNLKNMVNNYNTVRSFSGMGESEKYLVNNFVGTTNSINLINS